MEGPLLKGESKVAVAVEPGQQVVICGGKTPWIISNYTPEVAARAAISAVYTTEFGRAAALKAEERAGYLVNEHGERILSVRLHDKFERSEEHWERKRCNGYVHPGTRVALKGPTDIVRCNRRWHQLDQYE